MKAVIFQHVPFESPGYILNLLEEFGMEVFKLSLYKGDTELPVSFDMLIVMGGPMNIYEEQIYPWLTLEKNLIQRAIQEGKIVIGFCLGAQLLADALGSRVYKQEHPEIGWHTLQKTNADILNFLPDYASAFHWHGESFDIPEGAHSFYRSEATENQAFLYGDRVMALQFHLEMTESIISDLCVECKSDMTDSPFVMTVGEIMDGWEKYHTGNRRMLKNIMKYLISNYQKQFFTSS